MEVSIREEINQIRMERPHVVILGAGASYAAFPNGDKNGKWKKPFIKEVRQITRHHSGGKDQYHCTVQTKEDKYFRLSFYLHTITWRLVDEVAPDRAIP